MGANARHTGFTVVELLVVMATLSIISVYVVMKNDSVTDATLSSQAYKLASDIRHAQMLATTWGKRLRLTIVPGANGSYSVSCVTAGATAPCNASPVVDPATGQPFSVSLQKGAVLGGPATLDFSSLGQPGGAASYTLSGSSTSTVSVAALTGHVTVSP